MRAHRAMTSRLGCWTGFAVLRVLTSEPPGILGKLYGTHPMKSYCQHYGFNDVKICLNTQIGFTVPPRFDTFESDGFLIFQSRAIHDASDGFRGPGTLDANQDALVHRSPEMM